MATLIQDVKKTAKTKLVRNVSRAVFGRGLVGGAIGKAFEKKFLGKEEEDTRISDALEEQSSLQDEINSTVVRIEAIVTNIADNVYNIAGVLNAQITSMEEARREQRERLSRQQAAEEEAANEASRVAAPGPGTATEAAGDKKGITGVLSSILGTVKNTRKLFGGFLKKFAVVAGAVAVAGGAAYAASQMGSEKEGEEPAPGATPADVETAPADANVTPAPQQEQGAQPVEAPQGVASPPTVMQQPPVPGSPPASEAGTVAPQAEQQSQPQVASVQPPLVPGMGTAQGATDKAQATGLQSSASGAAAGAGGMNWADRRKIQREASYAEDTVKEKSKSLAFAEQEISELQQEWTAEKTQVAESLAKQNKKFSLEVGSPDYPNEFKQIDEKYTKSIAIKKTEAARTRTEISSAESQLSTLRNKLAASGGEQQAVKATAAPVERVSAPPPASVVAIPSPSAPVAATGTSAIPTQGAVASAPTAPGASPVASSPAMAPATPGASPVASSPAMAPATPGASPVASSPVTAPAASVSGADFIPPPVSTGAMVSSASKEVAAASEMSAPKNQLIQSSSATPPQGNPPTQMIPSPIADRGTLDINTTFDAGM